MKKINQYIQEKLIIDKDVKARYKPEAGDIVMSMNFLSSEHKDCILKVAKINSLFRNNIYVDYLWGSTSIDRMYAIVDDEDYIGKTESGDILFDKDTAMEMIEYGLKKDTNNIWKETNIVTQYTKDYLNQIKREIERGEKS